MKPSTRNAISRAARTRAQAKRKARVTVVASRAANPLRLSESAIVEALRAYYGGGPLSAVGLMREALVRDMRNAIDAALLRDGLRLTRANRKAA